MENESNTVLFISGADAVRIEHSDPVKKFRCEIVRKGGGVLKTVFDSDGAILSRKPLPPETDILKESDDIASNFGDFVTRTEYSDVKLERSCPSCSAFSLQEQDGPVPIVPVYVCRSCGSKSFLLTDEYLSQLVGENLTAFNDGERSELSKDPSAFSAELKEYIIRIFASKRIIAIK